MGSPVITQGNMPPKYGPIIGPTRDEIPDLNNTTSSARKLENRYSEVDIKKQFNPFRFKNNVEPYMGGLPMIFMTTPQMNIFQSDSEFTTGQTALSYLTGNSVYSSDNAIQNNIINGLNGNNQGSASREINDIATQYARNTALSSIATTLDQSSSLFSYYNQTDPELVRALTYGSGVGGTTSPWIKFLTNLFKGLPTLKDLSMRTTEEYESYLGWKQILPGPNTDSYSADNALTVNFEETKNLDVIKFHTMWMEYIEAVRYGSHTPSLQMRNRRTIDYTSSLYYFVLDFDLSKILYWCKYTGIYPTNVPHSMLTQGDIVTRGPLDVGITYAYQYKEELRPTVIYDFNSVAKFAHKVIGYGRASLLHDNIDKTYDSTPSEYGWGDINKAPNGSFGSINFANPANRSFNNVEIQLVSNSTYDSRNQTGFSSDTNMTRNSFHLVFNNSDDKGYEAGYDYDDSYENNYLWNDLMKDVVGTDDNTEMSGLDKLIGGGAMLQGTLAEPISGIASSINNDKYEDIINKEKPDNEYIGGTTNMEDSGY